MVLLVVSSVVSEDAPPSEIAHHEHELQLALDAIRKDLRISSALDSDDIHKALLKAGFKKLI